MHLLSGLKAELSNINSIYTSYQPLIQAATQLLQKDPSFDRIPISSKCMKISLLLFLGDALRLLTSTVTTKDINSIKSRINQLISMQQSQQEMLVDVISIINVTRYATQINRQHINILMDTTEKIYQDITTLYNITHSLYNSISYQQTVLHIRSILANLQDSIHYYERSHPSHHGLYWCSHYWNTHTTYTTCSRSEEDAEIHWGYTTFHNASANFLWGHPTFLQISMHPHPNLQMNNFCYW